MFFVEVRLNRVAIFYFTLMPEGFFEAAWALPDSGIWARAEFGLWVPVPELAANWLFC